MNIEQVSQLSIINMKLGLMLADSHYKLMDQVIHLLPDDARVKLPSISDNEQLQAYVQVARECLSVVESRAQPDASADGC